MYFDGSVSVSRTLSSLSLEISASWRAGPNLCRVNPESDEAVFFLPATGNEASGIQVATHLQGNGDALKIFKGVDFLVEKSLRISRSRTRKPLDLRLCLSALGLFNLLNDVRTAKSRCALSALFRIASSDWQRGCLQGMQRRRRKGRC